MLSPFQTLLPANLPYCLLTCPLAFHQLALLALACQIILLPVNLPSCLPISPSLFADFLSCQLCCLAKSFDFYSNIQVWCCAIANDNEIVISGSKDCTIRLWRLEDGAMIAAINTVVDVFKVLLSNNKKTVVALADKFGARKLIMLQVVRTMVRSATGSRATSPLLASDSNLRY